MLEGATEPDGAPWPTLLAHPDPVEVALADAITKAANDGRHDVVKALVDELQRRREARAQVVQLEVERAKRSK